MSKLNMATTAKFTVMDQLDVPLAEQTKLYIEGYASVNRKDDGTKNVDRDNEVYDIPSLNIDNFKNNGPIVFMHDWKQVVGEVTSIEKTFKGLYIKAEIHKVPGLENVFYGIQKGLIKAFSINAIPKTYSYLENEDALELLDAELVEISVLAVPSNAQSLFTVTNAKSLRVDAQEIANQNDMTLCELKGICGLSNKEKEKGVNMSNLVKKEPTAPAVEPKVEPVAPVVEPKVEPKVEPVTPVVEPKVDTDAIANAIVEAQAKAEEIRQAAIEAAAQAKAEADKAAADALASVATNALAYIQKRTEEFISMNNEDVDTETIEEFYEVLTTNVEKIEQKITSVITSQLAPQA
jgi:HK97 family phage prohead protease